MHIAFITEYDPTNIALRSGVPYFIHQGLLANGYKVDIILVKDCRYIREKIISRMYHFYYNQLIKGKKGLYNALWGKAISKSYARSIQNIDLSKYNAAISISTLSCAYVHFSCPFYIWVDNTYKSTSFNPNVGKLSYTTKIESSIVDELCLQKATIFYTASTWLQKIVQADYPSLANKVKVLPRGANIFNRPPLNIIQSNVQKRLAATELNLLFISSNWYGKGGDIVLEIYKTLHKQIACSLTIIGNIKPISPDVLAEKGIRYIGYIPQTEKSTSLIYQQLMAESHILLVPSRADGFGNVYAEAASYGIPSVAFGIMGVTESVKHGITGFALPENATSQNFADTILEIWNNKQSYHHLSLASYQYALEHFDWEKNTQKLVETNI